MDMSQVYQESFGKLFTNLQNLNPQEEYTKLIEENKRLGLGVCVCVCVWVWVCVCMCVYVGVCV